MANKTIPQLDPVVTAAQSDKFIVRQAGDFEDKHADMSVMQLALQITESQITDLQAYLTDITGEPIGDLSDVFNSTPADRHVLVYDGVTDNRYENRLLVEADISDLQAYLTAEVNDLTAAVVWDNVPDANITQSSVTQHEAALTITESQISDLQAYLLTAGFADLDTDLGDFTDIGIGYALDNPKITVSSNGTTITLSLQDNPTGDIRFLFTDGVYTHDCTPADTVALTAGTDISPTLNYVYILQSTKTLTASTSGWPGTEHAKLGTVLCQSAASLQTDGAYKVHAWTNHTTNDIDGELAHFSTWIRNQNATWTSGALVTPTVGVATFDLAVSAGSILQLHPHASPSFDTSLGSEVMIPNDNTTAYKRVGDLTGELTDANGVSMSNRYYNLVVWMVVSEDGGDSQLMVNLPTASYLNESDAQLDSSATAVFDIPTDFRGTGVLLARLTIKHNSGPGSFVLSQNTDLRGLGPATSVGGGGGGAGSLDELSDVFNSAPVDRHVLVYDGVTDNRYENRLLVEADISDLQSYGFGDVTKVGTPVDNQVGVWTGDGTIEGTTGLTYDGATLVVSGGAGIGGVVATILPTAADSDTGLGSGGTDNVTMVLGGIEGHRWREFNGEIVQWVKTVNITASTTQTQGQEVLQNSYVNVNVVNNPNDVVTLPGLGSPTGAIQVVMNSGANTLQVYPTSGDDLGQGVNVSTTIEPGHSKSWHALDSTNWQLVSDSNVTEVNDLSAAVTWVNVPDANITQSSVTQHEGAIDHDSLLNFVANEHIDWTADQGATNINNANIELAVNDLTDAFNSTPADRHVLVYDGVTDNRYENRALVEADISDLQSYGFGDVTKVGTPVNNQIGVWTGDGTIEGTSSLTFSGTLLELGGWFTADSVDFKSVSTGGPALRNLNGSSTTPTVVPDKDDTDTGLGHVGPDLLSIIAGGVEIARASESTEDQFIVSPGATLGSQALPSLAFGDGDTGFYESADDVLRFVVDGNNRWGMTTVAFDGAVVGGPSVRNETSSLTNPTFAPHKAALNSGIGGDSSGVLSLIANSVEGLRLTEANSGVIQAPNANVAITAFAGGGQGSATQLDESYNVITTVATTGDSVKLPPAYAINSLIYIKNDGANDADVFPASGDDLGAGVDTAVSIAAGSSLSFIATVANSTWTQLFVDTTGGGASFPEYLFYADQFENPNNADWDVNALAPAAADSNNAALTVRLFDDATQEAVGMSFRLPATATNVVFEFVSRAETAPGGAVAAKPAIETRTIGDNAAVPAPPWNTLNLTKVDLPTNENFQYDSQTISFATLLWTAGTYVQMQLTRNPTHPDDNLVGDWALLACRVSFT